MLKDIVIPDLGEGIDAVDVGEVHIKPGDHVNVDDVLVVLETEKASMEIPAERPGTVKEVLVEAGGQVKAQDVIARIEMADQAEEAEPAEDATQAEPAADPAVESESEPEPVLTPIAEEDVPEPPPAVPAPPKTTQTVLASPSVRRFARELGAEISEVSGTGAKGRIIKEDVQAFIKARMQAPPMSTDSVPVQPEIDFSQWGEVESVSLNKIRKASSQNLQNAWRTIPHVTQYDTADITELEEFRKQNRQTAEQQGGKLSILPFIMKASARALQSFPDFNSSLDSRAENLILKKYIHQGIAVDTPNGLVVPVIRDVDQKSLIELAVELVDVSQRTRDKKILPAELMGASFSISSLGGISGTGFSPIVNPPQVAILGVSRTEMRPVWNGEEFQPRLVLPFSLSYDHRVIDGAAAARFTRFLSQQLTDIRHLLL